MGVDGGMFYAMMDSWIKAFLALCVLGIFGVWKLVEIIIWLFSHIHWS